MAMTRPLMTLATCALMTLAGTAQAQTHTRDGMVILPVDAPSNAARVDPGTVSPHARRVVTEPTIARDGTVLVSPARTTFDTGRPPSGFKSAWDDGRVNPHRGPRTLQGDYQSSAIWTNTTPRERKPVIFVQR